jgi:hypothetical protein
MMGQAECSETLAFKLQTPVSHPEENTEQLNCSSLGACLSVEI